MLFGGAGSDSINNTAANVTIGGGDANDTIENTGSTASILGGDGNDTIINSGLAVTIDGDEGNDQITNTGTSAVVYGGQGTDSIYNEGADSTVYGGDGNDYIQNVSVSAVLYGDAGADSINNSSANVTIDGGEGNDSITNTGTNVSINGGGGDDFINGSFEYATLNGGAGNDTIATSYGNTNNVYQFDSVGGNDLIRDFAAHGVDTLQITGGEISSHTVSGSDYIVSVGESASITLQGAGTRTFTLMLANGTSSIINPSSAQLAPEFDDYWFTEDELLEDDEIGEIIKADAAIDLQFDDLSETFKPKTIELAISARHRQQK